MRNLLFCLCLSFAASVSFSQPLLEKILSNEIKLALSDGVRFDDGNWMFSAFAYSVTPGDSAMAIVLKTDSTFTPLWAKRYKYLRRDDFSCMTLLMDGNVLVGGTMRQDFSLQDGGSVFKLDTAGNVIWHLMYDEAFGDRVLDIFEQADSSLMIFIREGVTNQPTKVIHASKTGNILSQRAFSVDNNLGLLANTVVVDENEQYYFSGTVFLQGTSELYVCAVNADSLLWYKRFKFGDRSVGHFNSAYNPADQTLILGGSIVDTVGIFVNIWLAKMDLQGDLVWIKEYGRDLGYTENVSAISPLPNGDFMIHGSVFDDQGSQGFAMQLDSMGNQRWARGYAPTSPSVGIGNVFFLPDGRMLLNANSGEEVFLITTTAGGENTCNTTEITMNVAELSAIDATYVLTSNNPGVQEFIPPLEIFDISINDSLSCAGSVGISEVERRSLEIYPNPAHDRVAVVMPEGSSHKVACTLIDAWGRKITPNMTHSPGEIRMDVSGLPAGMYWILLHADGKVYAEKFVKR